VFNCFWAKATKSKKNENANYDHWHILLLRIIRTGNSSKDFLSREIIAKWKPSQWE
jgi:hypothetical protein